MSSQEDINAGYPVPEENRPCGLRPMTFLFIESPPVRADTPRLIIFDGVAHGLIPAVDQ
jgi:hypothetical protein